MKLQTSLMAFVLAAVCLGSLAAAGFGKIGDKKSGVPPFPVGINEYGAPWTVEDRNNDGKADHAVQYDKKGKTLAEAFDFNFDGKMDDFYVFEDGVLAMENLDTNYDGAIDLWVFMYKGVYVAGYERDSNFDGSLEIVKQFGRDSLVKR